MKKVKCIRAGDAKGKEDGGESQEEKRFGRRAQFVGAQESQHVICAADVGRYSEIELF
jgi:hypothetical protein